MRFVTLFLFCFLLTLVSGLRRGPAQSHGLFPDAAHPVAQDSGLFLSSMLDNPKIAQEASRVRIPGSHFADPALAAQEFVDLGYSGYITVNATTNSNTFFWFIPALQGNQSAPILAWFNGGPGATSLYGMFEELGPYYSDASGDKLFTRQVTWNNPYSIVYVDNPVGTGWSFTDSDAGFSTNQDQIADNLYSFFTQFFTLFPQYQPNDFYITGESYAGKYTTSIGYKIHNMNQQGGQPFINLKGISVGDGIMAPEYQIPGYGELLYNEGMLDLQESQYFTQTEQQVVSLIQQGQYVPAFRLFDALLNGDFWPYPTSYTNFTGLSDYFNIQQPQYPPNNWQGWMNQPAIRQAIHVGNHVFWAQNSTVEYYLLSDWFHSNEKKLPTLFENYRILIYNGAFDVILSAVQCENFLNQLDWPGRARWQQADKSIWKITPHDWAPAGYVKKSPDYDFTYVVVREAGHLLPQDQPARGFDMITRFIDNLGWGN